MAFEPEGFDIIAYALSGGQFRLASYITSDDKATVTGAGYFANAALYGIKLETLVIVLGEPGSGTPAYMGRINAVDAEGAATLVVDPLEEVDISLSDFGITATASELNTLDGATLSTAELNLLDGVTASTSELNILDGVTASASELNTLDGITASTTELNYTDGVTSAIQTQIDGKAATSHTHLLADVTDAGDLAALDTITTSQVAAGTLVTEAEGLASSDNDTSFPTTAAVKDYVDTAVSGAGTGTVDTANSPNANEFARFTDADTIEGRTASEVRADLDLEAGTDFYSIAATDSAIDADVATHAALTATHGVAGAIVGTSDSQTLTNKTIDADSNTLSNIEVADLKSSAVVTEAEGLASSDNDTSVPTTAAVIAYVAANSGSSSLTRDARTSNTILGTSDKGKLIEVTSGTFTQTFTAAATLGNGWYVFYTNKGTGDVTLDPNSSEQIDGLTSFIMYPSEMRLILCDGSAFYSYVLKPFYRTWTATAAGGFVKPPGYTRFRGYLWGGGGGGGRKHTTNWGSGGGGGACAPIDKASSDLGATEDITIGAGGTGKLSGEGSGNGGGASTFAGTTAGGGDGGNSSQNSPGDGGDVTWTLVSSAPPHYRGDSVLFDGVNSNPISTEWGGASSTNGLAVRRTIWGGGGGANASATVGQTLFGGAGGLSTVTTSAAGDGTAPGGGGGGSGLTGGTGGAAGSGARGELRLTGVV